MFITSKYAGYNRKGEQSAAGYFLILCQPKNDSQAFPEYQNVCRECGEASESHKVPEPTPIHQCPSHGIVARLKARAKAKQEPQEADFQEIMPQPDCLDCIRHKADVDALGCTRFQPISNSYKIRGLVRYVRMRQMGQWMMGTARILGHSITLSGSYGSDGLPCSVPDEVYKLGTELPDDLYHAWNTGGGWNGAGSEAPAMRAWALRTFPNQSRSK